MGWRATETGEKEVLQWGNFECNLHYHISGGVFIVHICVKIYQIVHSKNVWFIVSIIPQQSCKKLKKKKGFLIMSKSYNVHRGSIKMYMLGSASGSEN